MILYQDDKKELQGLLEKYQEKIEIQYQDVKYVEDVAKVEYTQSYSYRDDGIRGSIKQNWTLLYFEPEKKTQERKVDV